MFAVGAEYAIPRSRSNTQPFCHFRMLVQTQMAVVFTTSLLLVVATTPTAAESCTDSPPLSLPIADVALANGHTMRGIPMSVGSPPQNISFLPHK